MKIPKKIQNYILDNVGLQSLLIVLMILTAVYLLMLTSSLWFSLISIARRILFPFALGFTFAYLVYPITRYLERFKFPRAVSVIVVVFGVSGLLTLVFAAVIPNLIDDFALFGQNIVDSVQQLYNLYIQSNDNPSEVVLAVYTELVNLATEFSKQIPLYITGFITSAVSVLTTILFSFVIGVYFVFDYERFRKAVGSISMRINRKFYLSLRAVDDSVRGYIRTESIIILITFFEYTFVYFLIGHNYALLMGILTALSMLVPYIGPTIMHGIGILTSLTLGIPRALLLAVLLITLSQVDGYVITPMVFNKRDKLEPLWSLFSFFACSVMFGFFGILISMPLYFSVNSILKLRASNWQ